MSAITLETERRGRRRLRSHAVVLDAVEGLDTERDAWLIVSRGPESFIQVLRLDERRWQLEHRDGAGTDLMHWTGETLELERVQAILLAWIDEDDDEWRPPHSWSSAEAGHEPSATGCASTTTKLVFACAIGCWALFELA